MEKIIIAPHIDDEVIGCYSILKTKEVKSVYYLFELTEERKLEANKLAQIFGFAAIFQDPLQASTIAADEVYIPSLKDMHPHHKESYYWALKNHAKGKIIYYTVDKNIPFKVLSKEDQEEKRKLLDTYYPSQAKLWQRDDKYILFEGFREIDATIWTKVNTQIEGYHQWVDAPEKVSFLRDRHRHMFHVTVWIEQSHVERDIEYMLFKWEVNDILKLWIKNAGTKWSCESLAEYLRNYFIIEYKRNVKVQVMEDSENGTLLE